tara:strand:+ start:194 stop:493 length:300 start_codon:yes stop_codon:yes gene_type:complete
VTYKALPDFLHVKDSPVAGQGIFALEDIPEGVDLGLSHIVLDEEIYRTPLGGFINHSEEPNCIKWKVFVPHKYLYSVKTIKPIKKGEELFLKYTFYKVL